jgi:hypothetical protein
MTMGQRRSWEWKEFLPAGEYTLLGDAITAEDGETYSRGDTLALGKREATRLGDAGVIAPPASMYAVAARAESGRGNKRDEYLLEMWKLAGVWRERERF